MSFKRRSARIGLVIATLTAAVALLFARVVQAQSLSTQSLSGALTAEQLVSLILGSGVTASNIEYSGAPVAAGVFSGGSGVLGFEQGVILSSGDVANVIGPNQDDEITGENGTGGDPDLTALAGQDTEDAAVLEFDFVPTQSTISFSYVFASDEYNEYVGSQFNDVFAFFVNGANCATVGGQPVSINTINGGNAEDGVPPTNPEFYRNNDLDDGGGAIDTEMDGLTTVLPCTAPVNPGVTNHIKLAIADASDDILDSVVFLEAGSFVSGPTPVPGTPAPTATPTPTPLPVGPQPTPAAEEPALVTVVQRPNPNMAARRSSADFGVSQVKAKQAVVNDGIVDYVVEVVNRGEGRAKNTLINIPFDPTEQRLLDAKFSRDTAWVSRVMTNSLELNTGALNPNGDTITMTVRLLVRPGAPLGASLSERVTYRWDDFDKGGEGRSNASMLTVAANDDNRTYYPLAANPVEGPAGSTHAFSSGIFAPGEPVSLWYHAPNGDNVGVTLLAADNNGNVTVNFTTTGLATGNYTMVAYGAWTEFTAVGAFSVR